MLKKQEEKVCKHSFISFFSSVRHWLFLYAKSFKPYFFLKMTSQINDLNIYFICRNKLLRPLLD